MDGGQAGITEDPYISSSKAGDSSGGKEARNNWRCSSQMKKKPQLFTRTTQNPGRNIKTKSRKMLIYQGTGEPVCQVKSAACLSSTLHKFTKRSLQNHDDLPKSFCFVPFSADSVRAGVDYLLNSFLFLCCKKNEEMQTQWKGAMHGLWFHICQVRTERFLWAGTQMALSFTCKDILKADFDVWCQSWGVIMTNYHVWWLKVLEVTGCHTPQLEPTKQNCLFFCCCSLFCDDTDWWFEIWTNFFFLSLLLLHVCPTFISVFHVYQHRQGAVIAKINAAYLPAAFTIRPNEINNPP